MESEKQLNSEILEIIKKINETSPELSKYIIEMDVSISYSADSSTKIKNLKEYYNSLRSLLSSYQNHQ